MKFFLDMAWDIEQFNFDNAYTHHTDFLTSIFGEKYRDDLVDIINNYYLLGFQHKPEGMGWGYQWNNYLERERIIDTEFSLQTMMKPKSEWLRTTVLQIRAKRYGSNYRKNIICLL